MHGPVQVRWFMDLSVSLFVSWVRVTCLTRLAILLIVTFQDGAVFHLEGHKCEDKATKCFRKKRLQR